MAKMIRVYDCSECPHYGDIEMDGVNYAFCLKAERQYDALDVDQIPGWCPLPDAPEAE